jgi:hypothetical protein
VSWLVLHLALEARERIGIDPLRQGSSDRRSAQQRVVRAEHRAHPAFADLAAQRWPSCIASVGFAAQAVEIC